MKRVKGPHVSREDLRSAKIRVTTYLDEDVLDALKLLAGKTGGRYQTLLNQLLRQTLVGDSATILERLEKLEKAVFHRTAA